MEISVLVKFFGSLRAFVLRRANQQYQKLHCGPKTYPFYFLKINLSKMNRFLANVNSRSRSLYAVARPSVVCLSVTLVRPTQAVEIFGNISTACSTLAIL